MMCRVSGPGESNGRGEMPEDTAGVLANLPRTRPQRATAGRAAARRKATQAKTSGEQGKNAAKSPARAGATRARSTTGAAKPSVQGRATATGAARKTAKRPQEPVPRQGFASEEDRATGTVQPPGALELLGGAIELIGGLTRSGVDHGERLMREIVSLLPR